MEEIRLVMEMVIVEDRVGIGDHQLRPLPTNVAYYSPPGGRSFNLGHPPHVADKRTHILNWFTPLLIISATSVISTGWNLTGCIYMMA